jgi:hypothetical protein
MVTVREFTEAVSGRGVERRAPTVKARRCAADAHEPQNSLEDCHRWDSRGTGDVPLLEDNLKTTFFRNMVKVNNL